MAGATLLEVLVAMLVIGLVATGVVTAFIFSRKVTWRSGTELFGAGLVTGMVDELRNAVPGTTAEGLTLVPGIYVDDGMPNRPAGAVTLPVGGGGPNPLNFPAGFLRFQDPASGVAGATVAANNHGDGRLVVVESPVDTNGNGTLDPAELTAADLDGDGQTGLDLDGDGQTDLRRVRIRVKWTSPAG